MFVLVRPRFDEKAHDRPILGVSTLRPAARLRAGFGEEPLAARDRNMWSHRTGDYFMPMICEPAQVPLCLLANLGALRLNNKHQRFSGAMLGLGQGGASHRPLQ
jgi:hypothetical protein